jgi:hypothetical protein
MKKMVLALALAVATVTAASAATVYVPKDTTPFAVQQGDAVRLTGQGIAGATIKADVSGPANVIDYDVVELVRGKPLIGNHRKDFIVRPSGKGTVKVKITVTPP